MLNHKPKRDIYVLIQQNLIIRLDRDGNIHWHKDGKMEKNFHFCAIQVDELSPCATLS